MDKIKDLTSIQLICLTVVICVAIISFFTSIAVISYSEYDYRKERDKHFWRIEK